MPSPPQDPKAPALNQAGANEMVSNELAADPELLNDFILESREHLTALELHLLALDQDPNNREALHAIFRGFHTIKGLAGFLGLSAIQEIAHEVETVLDLARNGEIQILSAQIDVILATKDYLNGCLIDLAEVHGKGVAPAIPDNSGLLQSVRGMVTAKADPVARTLSALSTNQDAPREAEPPAAEGRGSESQSVKVETRKLDFLVDMVGEMIIAQSMVMHDPELALGEKGRLARSLGQLARITGDVQRTAMSMRMVPIRQLFQKMSRLVRDLSRKTGKQVELEMAGEETELDRLIVEELADPLMHMVRNSVDHGVEGPQERVRAGKEPVARVLLKAGHQAGYIILQLTDDGRGLNAEKILRKAREKGLVDPGAQPGEAEIFNLIFAPGFSTAEQVTDVSGRGVGMDVVKRQIQKLRGKIEIQSTPGRGATFFLKLPLTLAIIDGLLAGVGAETYIVPIFAVREMFRPSRDMVSTVENRDEMVVVRGSLLPVVRLHRRFAIRPRSEDLCESLLIVTEAEGRRFCLVVDDLKGKQEVVIKTLGASLGPIRGVAGGAILGDGRVGLILDPEGLLSQAAV
jgi:two-component system chemotaxis sensor kinase CheA